MRMSLHTAAFNRQVTSRSHPGHIQVTTRSHPGHVNSMKNSF
jgi:hypothetical protein